MNCGAGLDIGRAPKRELLPARAEEPGTPTKGYRKPHIHPETKKCPIVQVRTQAWECLGTPAIQQMLYIY